MERSYMYLNSLIIVFHKKIRLIIYLLFPLYETDKGCFYIIL